MIIKINQEVYINKMINNQSMNKTKIKKISLKKNSK